MFKEKNDRLICSLAAGILLALIEWFIYKNLWVTAACLAGGAGLFYLVSSLIAKKKSGK